jgi:hypothetical protein
MNLLFRFIRFLALLAFNLLFRLIVLLIRLLLPFLLAVLRGLSGLVFTSLSATVNGPGQYIDRLASEWTAWILSLGVDRGSIDRIYSLCRFLVASRLILGWTVATLFTVAILRVVFGIFI